MAPAAMRWSGPCRLLLMLWLTAPSSQRAVPRRTTPSSAVRELAEAIEADSSTRSLLMELEEEKGHSESAAASSNSTGEATEVKIEIEKLENGSGPPPPPGATEPAQHPYLIKISSGVPKPVPSESTGPPPPELAEETIVMELPEASPADTEDSVLDIIPSPLIVEDLTTGTPPPIDLVADSLLAVEDEAVEDEPAAQRPLMSQPGQEPGAPRRKKQHEEGEPEKPKPPAHKQKATPPPPKKPKAVHSSGNKAKAHSVTPAPPPVTEGTGDNGTSLPQVFLVIEEAEPNSTAVQESELPVAIEIIANEVGALSDAIKNDTVTRALDSSQVTETITQTPGTIVQEEIVTNSNDLNSSTITKVPEVIVTDKDTTVADVIVTDKDTVTKVPDIIVTKNATDVPDVIVTDKDTKIPEVIVTKNATDVPDVIATDKYTNIPDVIVTDKDTVTKVPDVIVTNVTKVPDMIVTHNDTMVPDVVVTDNYTTVSDVVVMKNVTDVPDVIFTDKDTTVADVIVTDQDTVTKVPEMIVTKNATDVADIIVTDKYTNVPDLIVTGKDTVTQVPEMIVIDEDTKVPEMIVTDKDTKVPEMIVTDKDTKVPEMIVTDEDAIVPDIIVTKNDTKVPNVIVTDKDTVTEVADVIITDEDTMTEVEVIVKDKETVTKVPHVTVTDKSTVRKVPDMIVTDKDIVTNVPDVVVTNNVTEVPDIIVTDKYTNIPDVIVTDKGTVTKVPEVIVTDKDTITKVPEVIVTNNVTEIPDIIVTDKYTNIPDIIVTDKGTVTKVPEVIVTDKDTKVADVIVTDKGTVNKVPDMVVTNNVTKVPDVIVTDKYTNIPDVIVTDKDTVSKIPEVIVTDNTVTNIPVVTNSVAEVPDVIITDKYPNIPDMFVTDQDTKVAEVIVTDKDTSTMVPDVIVTNNDIEVPDMIVTDEDTTKVPEVIVTDNDIVPDVIVTDIGTKAPEISITETDTKPPQISIVETGTNAPEISIIDTDTVSGTQSINTSTRDINAAVSDNESEVVDTIVSINDKGESVTNVVTKVTVPESHFKELYFNQLVDHFSFTSHQKLYRQRYLLTDQFWVKNFGPIFLYTGNEGDIWDFANSSRFIIELASEQQAMVIFAEHRYYGKSLPFGKKSYDKSNIEFLTIEQAVADYVILITQLKADHNANNCSVIVFGGSYGGMLSAYMRIKYPNVVDGALASSAPVVSTTNLGDSRQFFHDVTKDFERNSPDCVLTIRRGFQELEALAQQQAWSKIASKLPLCKAVKSKKEIDHLYGWARNAFTYLSMFNYPYKTEVGLHFPANPVDVACRYILKKADHIEGLLDILGMFYNSTGNKKCFDIYTEYIHCSDPTGCGLGPASQAWDYQACTEISLLYESNNDTDMFPVIPFTEAMRRNYCHSKWGVYPNQEWLKIQYWGDDYKAASNIIFSNGDLDPWANGGILKTVNPSVISLIIEGAAHHLDLRASNAADPPSVTLIRKMEASIIKDWVKNHQLRFV
ncbi:uncharacterized protein LOC144502552 isoform X1 [Mustelus asterias]